jgi:hypothetical protein
VLLRRLVVIVATLVVATGIAVWRGTLASAEAGAPRLPASDLVDAVLFCEGPAARYLDPDGRPALVWSDGLRQIQRDVKAAVAATGGIPLAERLQSGDPGQVDAALKDLGRIVREVLDRRFGRAEVEEAARRVDQLFADERADIVDNQLNRDTVSNTNMHSHDALWMVQVEILSADMAVDTLLESDRAVMRALVALQGGEGPFSENTRLVYEELVRDIADRLRVT